MTDYQPIDYRLRCHTKRTDLPADVLRDIGEAYRIVRKVADEEQLIERLDDILTKTANALHGDIPENGLHSWHDLPERAERLRKERDESRRLYCNVMSTVTSTYVSYLRKTPEQLAEDMNWDCFNTPEPKIVKTLNGVVVDGGKAVPPKYEDLDNG